MRAGWVTGERWHERARSLADDGWGLVNLCGLDRLTLAEGARFEVVVHLRDEQNALKTIHVVADGDPPTVPSVTEIWPVANWMEREAYDMFGIVFDGHPNLTRILMPDEWEGFPLRKDYGVGKVPIEFVPQPFLQIDAPGQSTTSQEAEGDVDELGQPGPARRDLGGAPGVRASSEDGSHG